ncbi:MAG: prephenate dehydratase [Cyclobacteriaceae bacterium]|nr:prephenate dehydratase [Cyclobacteriaceae bacterium]
MNSKKIKIGIQGVKASFHDVAARQYFGNDKVDLAEFRDFRSMSQAVEAGKVDFAMMAIENTLAGSLLPNYGLLEQYSLNIIGEEYLRIQLQLMVLPGETLDSVEQVISHPIALSQCGQFLDEYPNWKVTEADDTASSARLIAHKKLKGIAAIASSLAANTYGLKIIAPSIEINKKNFTRFLAIARKPNQSKSINKASLRLILSHKPEALSKALNVIGSMGLNLSKIQSVPIIGKPYEYAIHLDVLFEKVENFTIAMDKLKPLTLSLKILGTYHQGNKPILR